MQPNYQNVQADCTIEFQVIDSKTQKQAWEIYENLNFQGPTIEKVIERAQLYVGRPERHNNVTAIRLTGKLTIIDQEKDSLFDHLNTITLDLHILRKHSMPVSGSDDIASGQ
ncbi:hypothetical protein JUJ52_19725 [Virgibacillus sp. AGTR]|uniref:hypothetical protein n=1 Tax=Virgibacillus sp. AGTR TaxID=2812055 RepID=UPI001D15E5DC|nr:hypothetical protein [Virgibacillus sp. AGTR]MCC2252163.1 hypothetical protein [Virgibacillus sp. AGTR]